MQDAPDFPSAWRPIALACAEQLAARAPGRYRLGADDLVTTETGESRISTADLAVALLDEAERPKHHRTRFTVGY